ncbi:MAG: thioredoxin family protein [Bacteroidia bacterium]
MKRLLFLLFPLFTSLQAQTDTAVWYYDFETAMQIAATENKSVLMVFSGSDWCKPCIKLKKEVLDHPAFCEFAARQLVLLNLDFPRYKKNRLPDAIAFRNERLAEKYNPQGIFPMVVLLSPKGEVIDHTGYTTNQPQTFVQYLSNLISSR